MAKPHDNYRAVRLLDALGPTIEFDLPDLLVAVRGMLRLLQDGREDWSPSENDYLQRLDELIVRLNSSATAMRSLYKAPSKSPTAERIRLSELLREAAAKVKTALPKRALNFHTVLKKTEAVCARRLLLHALVEALSVLGEATASPEVHYCILSRRAADAVELTVLASPRDPRQFTEGIENKLLMPMHELKRVDVADLFKDRSERRLRLLLVRELAHCWDGTVVAAKDKNANSALILTVPTT